MIVAMVSTTRDAISGQTCFLTILLIIIILGILNNNTSNKELFLFWKPYKDNSTFYNSLDTSIAANTVERSVDVLTPEFNVTPFDFAHCADTVKRTSDANVLENFLDVNNPQRRLCAISLTSTNI